MKQKLLLLSMGCAALLLSSCASQTHQAMSLISPTAKSISEQTLANGAAVKVGMKRPTPSWKCKEIDSISYDWKKIRSESTTTITPYTVLTKKAVSYADDNHLSMNYIFINTPDHGITNAPYKTADTVYYQCQKIRAK